MLDLIMDMIDEIHVHNCEPTLWRFSNLGYVRLMQDRTIVTSIVWDHDNRNGKLYNIPIQIERPIPVGPRRRDDHRVHLDDDHGHTATRDL